MATDNTPTLQIHISDPAEIAKLTYGITRNSPYFAKQYFITAISEVFAAADPQYVLGICLDTNSHTPIEPDTHYSTSTYNSFGELIDQGFFGKNFPEALLAAAQIVRSATQSDDPRSKPCAIYWLAALLDRAKKRKIPYHTVLDAVTPYACQQLFQTIYDFPDPRHAILPLEYLIQFDPVTSKARSVGFVKYVSPELLAQIFINRWYFHGRIISFQAIFHLFVPTPAQLAADPTLTKRSAQLLAAISPSHCPDPGGLRLYTNCYGDYLPYLRLMPISDAEQILRETDPSLLQPSEWAARGIKLLPEDEAFIAAHRPDGGTGEAAS